MLRAPIAIGFVLIAGCSSAGPRPSAAGGTTTAAFLAHDGRPLLSFERATKPLVTGKRPERTICVRLLRDELEPQNTRAGLNLLLSKVPDRQLRDALTTDINDKSFLLGACVSATGLADSPDEDRVYALYRANAQRVVTLLARDRVSL